MSEFDNFVTLGFEHEGFRFRVPDDASTAGNSCLFASIIMFGLVPFSDASEFRTIVFDHHRSGFPGYDFAMSSYPLFAKGAMPFEHYLEKMTNTSKMASDFEMVLISM